MIHWLRRRSGWLTLTAAVALFVTRYIAWLNGFAWLPWLAYLVAWIALFVAVTRWIRRPILRIVLILGVAYFGWQLAWLDDTLAQREFGQLCQQLGGMHVYKRIELPGQFFTENGALVFMNEKGDVDFNAFPQEFLFRKEIWTSVPSHFAKVTKWRYEVRKRVDNELIAEQTQLSGQRGGPPTWAEANPVEGSPCPMNLDMEIDAFLRHVFFKQAASN